MSGSGAMASGVIVNRNRIQVRTERPGHRPDGLLLALDGTEMIEINRNPSRHDLLVFGGLLGLFTLLAGLLAHFFWELPAAARWIWIVGSGLTFLHFAVPPLRRWIYLGWMFAAYPLGWTISHILLLIVFFGIVTPTGLVLRIFGYDPMSRRDVSEARRSYWESYDNPDQRERYFRQF